MECPICHGVFSSLPALNGHLDQEHPINVAMGPSSQTAGQDRGTGGSSQRKFGKQRSNVGEKDTGSLWSAWGHPDGQHVEGVQQSLVHKSMGPSTQSRAVLKPLTVRVDLASDTVEDPRSTHPR